MQYPSGIMAIDDAFAGGIPAGSVLEIYGPTDAAKTALALWYIRSVQGLDPETEAVWVATERPPTMSNLDWAGIDPARLRVATPIPSVPGLRMARDYLDAADLVVIDSVAALVATSEAGDLEKLHQVLGDPEQGLIPVAREARAHQRLVILVNQERHHPGQPGSYHAGSCMALTRHVDYRIRLWPGEGLYRGAERRGVQVHFRVIKNGGRRAGCRGSFNCLWREGLRDRRLPVRVVLPTDRRT